MLKPFLFFFHRVEIPDDAVNTLSTNDHITVERDGDVHTLVSA